MNTTLQKQSIRTIKGCKKMPEVEKQINRAYRAGCKVQLEDCDGEKCNCKITALRNRKVELQQRYAKAGTNEKSFLWQEINAITKQLRQYGAH